jgi:hypothetical protein
VVAFLVMTRLCDKRAEFEEGIMKHDALPRLLQQSALPAAARSVLSMSACYARRLGRDQARTAARQSSARPAGGNPAPHMGLGPPFSPALSHASPVPSPSASA